MEDIELKVKKIVAEQLGIKEEDIKNESSFIEDLGADSLTTVEMSLALEDAFGIEIPDTEQENLRTVQQAIDYVKSAVNKYFRLERTRCERRPQGRPNCGIRLRGSHSCFKGKADNADPLVPKAESRIRLFGFPEHPQQGIPP